MGCRCIMQNNYNNSVVYGGFFARAFAHIIDMMIVGVITLLIRFPLWIISFGIPENIWDAGILFSYTIKDILLYICGVSYYVLFTYFTGVTLGKKLMNLRVVSADGGKLTLMNVIYRETIGRFLCTFILHIGYLIVGADREKRGLHDILSDTRVIYEKKVKINPVYPRRPMVQQTRFYPPIGEDQMMF